MADILALDGIRGMWFNDLANRWFQPLTHVSAWSLALTKGWLLRVATSERSETCQRRIRETRMGHRFVSLHRVLQSVRPMSVTERATWDCRPSAALSINAKDLRNA